jgi:hypothetical protein
VFGRVRHRMLPVPTTCQGQLLKANQNIADGPASKHYGWPHLDGGGISSHGDWGNHQAGSSEDSGSSGAHVHLQVRPGGGQRDGGVRGVKFATEGVAAGRNRLVG